MTSKKSSEKQRESVINNVQIAFSTKGNQQKRER